MENLQAPSLQPQIGRRCPYHPLVIPHPDGRTPHQCQMDLGDTQLWQLMEDLCQEVAQRELNVFPMDPLSGHWGTQQAMGTLMWMTKRSPSWEGGDGNQEDNHLNPLSHHPDKDVGCLINTLATGLHLGMLKSTPSVVKPCQGRQKCLLSNDTMRYNVLKTTIWNQSQGKHSKIAKRGSSGYG